MGVRQQDILSALGPATSGVAVAAPLVGGLVQSRAAGAAGEAAARASEFNARLERERGSRAAQQIRRAGSRAFDAGRLQIAASGVQAQGTPMQFLLDRALEAEQAAFEEHLAARRSAQLDTSRARAEREAGRRQGVSALLTGGTQALGTGLRLRREGAF